MPLLAIIHLLPQNGELIDDRTAPHWTNRSWRWSWSATDPQPAADMHLLEEKCVSYTVVAERRRNTSTSQLEGDVGTNGPVRFQSDRKWWKSSSDFQVCFRICLSQSSKQCSSGLSFKQLELFLHNSPNKLINFPTFQLSKAGEALTHRNDVWQ